jgi:hypothetical protein
MEKELKTEGRLIIEKNSEFGDDHLSLSIVDSGKEDPKDFYFECDNVDYMDFLDGTGFEYLNSFNLYDDHPLKHSVGWHDGGFLCAGVVLLDKPGIRRGSDIIIWGYPVSDYLDFEDEKYEGYEILCFYMSDGDLISPQVIIYNPVEYQKVPDEHKKSYILDLISKQIEGTFDITLVDDVVIGENDGFDELLHEPDENGCIFNWEVKKGRLITELKVYKSDNCYGGGDCWWVRGEIYFEGEWYHGKTAPEDCISSKSMAIYEARKFYKIILNDLELHQE